MYICILYVKSTRHDGDDRHQHQWNIPSENSFHWYFDTITLQTITITIKTVVFCCCLCLSASFAPLSIPVFYSLLFLLTFLARMVPFLVSLDVNVNRIYTQGFLHTKKVKVKENGQIFYDKKKLSKNCITMLCCEYNDTIGFISQA